MKILVLNTQILAVAPVDSGDCWTTPDQIIPKHVAEGAALFDVPGLPDDYAPGRYTFDGGFVRGADPVPVAPPPDLVTRRQGRLALLRGGYLADVEAAIAAIVDPIERQAAQIEYEADTWDRSNRFLQSMWAQLGGDVAGLDDLFRLAATL